LTFTGWFSGVWSARSGSGEKKAFDGLYSPVFPSNLTDVCAFPICSFYKGKEQPEKPCVISFVPMQIVGACGNATWRMVLRITAKCLFPQEPA
jgi:hypothetical protein